MNWNDLACCVVVVVLTCLLSNVPLFAQPAKQQGAISLEGLRTLRRRAAHRKRRIILNNDGCDAFYFPRDVEATPENLLNLRTKSLVGSQVDALFYCTISSGFSHFTHRTKVGTTLTHDPYGIEYAESRRNITQDLIDQGTDPLQVMVEFAREHGIEIFWSMRMNDTHDAAHKPDKPYMLFPPLKYDHPEWLVGDYKKRTPYGRWSSVDYGRPEIRDLAFKFIEEVCNNYDVDGIEMDFFRHLTYFKSTAYGKHATQDERDMMTDLIRRCRRMTEQVGMRRRKPILVAVRVPDSVEYCRAMGFDIGRWLEEGLIDLLTTTGYFRLNPWSYSAELGHKHGVQVYAGLSDSRVKGEGKRFRRSSDQSFRARAMRAWQAGVDGIYLFNMFNPKRTILHEIGEQEKLKALDKVYFATTRDGNPNSWLEQGAQFRSVPILTPGHPLGLVKGKAKEFDLYIGDDLAAAQQEGLTAEVNCHLRVSNARDARLIDVALNGRSLREGDVSKPWISFPVDPRWVKGGRNQVAIAVKETESPNEKAWSVEYDGTEKPSEEWARDPGSKRTIEKLEDGALFIADRGKESGDYLYYRLPWGVDPADEAAVEARVKVVSGVNWIIISNGSAHERIGLKPGMVDLYTNRAMRYEMDTTDDFHVYRVETKGNDLKVYVDGKLCIDAKGQYAPRDGNFRNEACFGAANSGYVGEAYWDYVKARPVGQCCQDFVLTVEYGKKK